MKDHEFTLILASDPDEETAETLDGVFQNGTLATVEGIASIDFVRESSNLETALRSAIADVRSAGLEVERVEFQPEALAQLG